MNRTFNNGIGMVLLVDAQHAPACVQTLQAAGETVFTIGAIVKRDTDACVVVTAS
jgi:phosphoribosylformylglycinamidine cyclo-ligase